VFVVQHQQQQTQTGDTSNDQINYALHHGGRSRVDHGFRPRRGRTTAAPARAPEAALALEAAQAAVAACLADNVKGAASVVDSAGVLRVLYAADGAEKNAVESSTKKAFTANALKEPTSELEARMQKDPAFKAKMDADQSLYPRPGALPLMVGNDVIGAIGFGGASGLNGVRGGIRDERCSKAGLDKIKARLK
jgi:uncharacterized protein GlcG (DUF336 family)